MESTWERVKEPDDPRRCQATNPSGQCMLVSVPGARVCLVHGGSKILEDGKKEVLRNYRLAKYHHRVGEMAESAHIKSLRDEIGILRMLVEERLNMCQEPVDLMLHTGPLSDLIAKIEKLVNSCHRLEASLGVLLDKTQAIQLGQMIVGIISKYIEEEDILDRISVEMVEAIAQLQPSKKE